MTNYNFPSDRKKEAWKYGLSLEEFGSIKDYSPRKSSTENWNDDVDVSIIAAGTVCIALWVFIFYKFFAEIV